MTGSQDEIEKAINIIIATKGTREATKEVETMHSKAHQGAEQLQRDAKKSTDANDLFTRKWKNELLMIGGALGAVYGLAKYSPVAASMIDILGVALGYLATQVLLPCTDSIVWLALKIIDLGDAFGKLPKPVKEAIGALAGLSLAYAFLKASGLLNIGVKVLSTGLDTLRWVYDKVKGPITQVVNVVAKEAAGGIQWILDKWNTAAKAGGLIGGAAYLTAFLAGFTIGVVVVDLMDLLGITKAIAKFGDDCLSQQPAIRDALKVLFAPFDLINDVVTGVRTGDFSKIPDYIQGTLDRVTAILDKWKIPQSFSTVGSALALIMNPLGALNAAGTGAGLIGTSVATGNMAPLRVSGNSTDTATMVTRNATAGTKTYSSGITVGYNPATDTDYSPGSTAPVAAAAVNNQTANTAAAAANTSPGIFDTITNIAKGFIPGLGIVQGLADVITRAVAPSPIPQYAAGGYVASDQIAQLHKGDWIRSKYGDTTRDSTGKTDKGSGGTVINGGITINTQSKNPEEIFRYVNQRLQLKTGSRV